VTNMDQDLEFCGKILGPGHPAFVVAEIGFNHNGDVELAKRMIESAAENGADAVKLQTFLAGEMVSRTLLADDPDHPGNEIPFYNFFQRYELSREDYKALIAHARTLNIPLFSTPFDDASLDMLVELGVPALKIASPDLTYTPFLERVAETGLPVVLSTGMGDEREITQALEALSKAKSVILLHCVSNYPAQYEEMNLACMAALRQQFEILVGLSDHTLDNLSAVVAASLGAVMIEKHFTLDRKLPGVDQSISMQPEDLCKLKSDILNVTKTLGKEKKEIQESEVPVKLSARRSLVALVNIPAGIPLEPNMLGCKRPGTGIPPTDLDGVLGKSLKVQVSAEQVLTWEMFS
jgi:N,N'-diacetyllegionaminate synthase